MYDDFEYGYMICQKNEDAFTTVLNNYRGMLISKANRCVAQHQLIGMDRDDVLQECYLAFYDALFSYKEHLNVGLAYYIVLCVDSRIRGILRRNSGKSYSLLNPNLSLDMAISEDETLYLGDSVTSTPFNSDPSFMSDYYDAVKVRDCVLDMMPEIDSDIYRLRQIGYSYAEISEIYNITPKHVDNTIQKVKKRINKACRKLLRDE